MSRIIINNDVEGLTDDSALKMVTAVIEQGMISEGTYGKQYCFLTTFGSGDDEIRVWANKTRSGTHSFKVYKDDV